MTANKRQTHWQETYTSKGEAGVSWFEPWPDVSLGLIGEIGATPASALVDIGGGASRLVDALLEQRWSSVTVLDISPVALDIAKTRLGERGRRVEWVVADVTLWEPTRRYDIWHDRAVFHFLTERHDRAAYCSRLRLAVRPGGHVIIATFAADGPERCSGLPVMRYDADSLAEEIGAPFVLTIARRYIHVTPSGIEQPFQFCVLRHAMPASPSFGLSAI